MKKLQAVAKRRKSKVNVEVNLESTFSIVLYILENKNHLKNLPVIQKQVPPPTPPSPSPSPEQAMTPSPSSSPDVRSTTTQHTVAVPHPRPRLRIKEKWILAKPLGHANRTQPPTPPVLEHSSRQPVSSSPVFTPPPPGQKHDYLQLAQQAQQMKESVMAETGRASSHSRPPSSPTM